MIKSVSKGFESGITANQVEADLVAKASREGANRTRNMTRVAAGLPRMVKGVLTFPSDEERTQALANLNALRRTAGLGEIDSSGNVKAKAPKGKAPKADASTEAPIDPPAVVNAPK